MNFLVFSRYLLTYPKNYDILTRSSDGPCLPEEITKYAGVAELAASKVSAAGGRRNELEKA